MCVGTLCKVFLFQCLLTLHQFRISMLSNFCMNTAECVFKGPYQNMSHKNKNAHLLYLVVHI